MARGSVNRVTLLGNLGGDPDMRYMTNGDTVTSLNLATTEVWRDKTSQDKKEQTEWHRVIVYGKLAEIVSKYAKKGSQVYVEGRLRSRKWLDAQNQNRIVTEIIANEVHVLSNRSTVDEIAEGTEGNGLDTTTANQTETFEEPAYTAPTVPEYGVN